MSLKICKNCVHYAAPYRCNVHTKIKVDPVSGLKYATGYQECEDMREGKAYFWPWSNCNYNGIHYKEIKI